MKTFAQTDTNDIFPHEGIVAMCSDEDAARILVSDAVRTLMGEIQLDTSIGIPYDRTIWGSSSKIDIWKHYVLKRVLEFDFVNDVSEFDATIASSKTVSYKMVIDTIYGKIEVEDMV